jgi:hypothetical protein
MMLRGSKNTFWMGLLGVFLLGICLRLYFAPDMNFETDSFAVINSARSISETDRYTITPIRLNDQEGSFQSHPGWAVGYSLFISFLISLFGYSESIIRTATILICSLVIPAIGFLGYRIEGKGMGIVAAHLVAVNPLLLCFNGRIMTANIGYALLTVSMSLLLSGVIRKRKRLEYASSEELLKSKSRFCALCLSFFFYGCTIMVRDDFAMFVFIYFFIAWGILRKQEEKRIRNRLYNYLKLLGTAIVLFFIGYSPNLYFNYKAYGRLFTSSHYEYGGRLSLEYFLNGSASGLGLPGWAVILTTVILYVLPIVAMPIVWRKSSAGALVGSVLILMLIPIFLINGSYAVSSTGASPRYMLPLIPFGALLAGILLTRKEFLPSSLYVVFIFGYVVWHLVLIYPPAILFKISPKFAYLTHYAPWYNTHNYVNYPHPVRSTLKWVKNNTPSDAIILSDYEFYHYYYYANRDVMDREKLSDVKRYHNSRRVFFVEDHPTARNRESLKDWKSRLVSHSLKLRERDSIPFFSPAKGNIQIKLYEIVKLTDEL